MVVDYVDQKIFIIYIYIYIYMCIYLPLISIYIQIYLWMGSYQASRILLICLAWIALGTGYMSMWFHGS